ncbi:MAG: metal-dependent phosphohydrolase, partial [Treponema sp.]|nr:metal-dependent phosphohydrolase [Treponema sp.]
EIMRCQTQEVFNINEEESFEKCVIEYISGMTDQFAISVFEEIVSF